jgi:hypothetical protein
MNPYFRIGPGILVIVAAFVLGCGARAANPPSNTIAQAVTADSLAVLWTSGDPDVASKVCFMYTHNAMKKHWFTNVTLIVWGPSSKLLAEDESLQAAVKEMAADGVVIQACKACADSYGISDKLSALGIDVKYMGEPLTEYLKAPNWKTMVF